MNGLVPPLMEALTNALSPLHKMDCAVMLTVPPLAVVIETVTVVAHPFESVTVMV